MKTAYNGKIARINLTTGEIKTEALDLDLAKKYIGGRGLASKIIYDEGIATVDPLSAQNKLVYATGAMTGTNSPTAGRYMVVTKSPLNNMIASSNSGGKWGAILKYAGWDALIVEGKSNKPVYINIEDEKIEILNAEPYVGMLSEELDDLLKEKHLKSSVLNIGPAGENQSLISAIINDKHRAAGRSGVGAVMGSKNLKAITVSSLKNVIEPFDTPKLKEVNLECLKKIRANGVTSAGLPTYGTAVLVNIINNTGSFPTKNWQGSYFDKADDISGETLKEKYLEKQYFCHRCPIGCGRVVKINEKETGGPEY